MSRLVYVISLFQEKEWIVLSQIDHCMKLYKIFLLMLRSYLYFLIFFKIYNSFILGFLKYLAFLSDMVVVMQNKIYKILVTEILQEKLIFINEWWSKIFNFMDFLAGCLLCYTKLDSNAWVRNHAISFSLCLWCQHK